MERRLLILGLMAVAAFAQIHPAAAQSSTPPFPHLGAYLIGGGNPAGSFNFSAYANIGNLDVAVITAYPGYSAGGKNLQQQVAAMKQANPAMKITVLQNDIQIETVSSTAFTAAANAAAYNNMWLRATYPNGGQETYGGSGDALVNIMSPNLSGPTYPPQGLTVLQWLAQFNVGFTTGVAPNLDGDYTDNFFEAPRTDGDYLQNGTTQSASNTTIQQDWRNAMARWNTALRTQMGSQYMHWGNVADWGNGSLQGYNQILNGGVMESAIGESYSYESTSWATLMNAYATIIKALAPFNGAGPYLVFQQDGAALSSSTYQSARYGLASCMLDNGYYHYNTAGQGGGNNVAWLDEMGVSLGAAVAGPNNPTNGTYSNGGLTVWQNGVWRRDFANGIALVNPKGNGPRTVTLETTYKHFSGTQDSSLNNGQSVTTVTLNDRDGVILLRLTPVASQAVPDAPTLSVQ